ncbi:hypothetical protein K330107F9_25470 [Bacteroides stercoris]|jgi:hypothetical protein|nr:hypothetical protein [Bacteroides caccae]
MEPSDETVTIIKSLKQFGYEEKKDNKRIGRIFRGNAGGTGGNGPGVL